MRERKTIFKKLILSYILILMFILTSVTVYWLNTQTTQIKQNIDNHLQNLSMNLSISPAIVECFERGEVSDDVKLYLDKLNKELEHIDYIVLVNTADIRLYHPNIGQIGKHFQGQDEGPALEGAEPYITEGIGTMEYQRRSFCSVYNEEKKVIGFIMVSATIQSIQLLQRAEILKYLTIFAAALFMGILMIAIFSRNLKNSLLGLEPKQISRMFLQRESILGTLSEGLLLIDENGTCEYRNPSAEKLLDTGNGFETDVYIKRFIEEYVSLKRKRRLPIIMEPIWLGDRFLLMDLAQVPDQNEGDKLLVVLNDQTEKMRLTEELTGVKHILKALRTTTHEHRNKMHIIFGLLKTGEIEEAVHFIADSVSAKEDDLFITETIRDKMVAALIIGKTHRAKELNIAFSLLRGSKLEENNPYLPSLSMVTVIGNLLENSFEAMTEKIDEREVSLYLNSSKEGLFIAVDDTGIGMDEECVKKVLKGNYTTKGKGHGNGFALICNTVQQYGGILEIESKAGEGSSISVTFRREEKHAENDHC